MSFADNSLAFLFKTWREKTYAVFEKCLPLNLSALIYSNGFAENLNIYTLEFPGQNFSIYANSIKSNVFRNSTQPFSIFYPLHLLTPQSLQSSIQPLSQKKRFCLFFFQAKESFSFAWPCLEKKERRQVFLCRCASYQRTITDVSLFKDAICSFAPVYFSHKTKFVVWKPQIICNVSFWTFVTSKVLLWAKCAFCGIHLQRTCKEGDNNHSPMDTHTHPTCKLGSSGRNHYSGFPFETMEMIPDTLATAHSR